MLSLPQSKLFFSVSELQDAISSLSLEITREEILSYCVFAYSLSTDEICLAAQAYCAQRNCEQVVSTFSDQYFELF